MPSVYDLKPKFQALLRPITNGLARAGVTANQVTVAALLLSIATGAALFYYRRPGTLVVLPIVLFVRMALNAVDGMLAREHNQQTALGAILNELGDVFSDSALYLPLAVLPAFNASLIVLVVILSVISEMTGVVAAQIGASRRYDGPMGKSDRAFVFGALGLLLGLGVPIAPFLLYVLCMVLALLIATILHRSRAALAELRSRASS